jgi:hypothetical protein
VEIDDAQGDSVLDAAGFPIYQAQSTITRAAQATIDAQFKRAKNYYDSYFNIHRAVFNILDDNIDDAFSNDPALVGWNQSMEPREMFDQITATYGKPTPAALLQNDTLFRRTTPPKYCSGALKIVKLPSIRVCVYSSPSVMPLSWIV